MQFLLIHGGWQGGWCWDAVALELRQHGHEVYAPTLRGLENGDVDRSGVTLTEMTARIAADVRDRNLLEVVAVGHSGGGPAIQLIYEADPGRFSRLVFIDAWVLTDGQCIYDILPQELAQGLRSAANATHDRAIPMPRELWCGALMNDVSEEEALSWLQRTVPCPEGWLSTCVKLPTFAKSTIPTSYVFLDKDVTVPRETYEANASRLRQPKVTESPGAHEAMLSRPKELAASILRVC
jgi:pimeloyl-ACP methyl ester carboxylesterase